MDGPTIVAATSGVLGAIVGAGATLLVARSERRASQRAELVAALAAFLTALDLIVMELRATAPPRPWLGALSRWLNRSLPEVGWLAAPLAELLSARPSALTDRFQVAANRLLAVAPGETLVVVEEAGELLTTWSEGAPEWEERWEAFRNGLQAHTRELAGITVSETPTLPRGRR